GVLRHSPDGLDAEHAHDQEEQGDQQEGGEQLALDRGAQARHTTHQDAQGGAQQKRRKRIGTFEPHFQRENTPPSCGARRASWSPTTHPPTSACSRRACATRATRSWWPLTARRRWPPRTRRTPTSSCSTS